MLAFMVIQEVRGLGEQMATFLGGAIVVLLLAWILIRIHKWLAILADALAVLSAWMILREVRYTESWLDHARGEQLDSGYVSVAAASVVLPLLGVTALLVVKKAAPNNSPEATPGERPPASPGPSSGAPQL